MISFQNFKSIQSYFENSQSTCRSLLLCFVGGTMQKVKNMIEIPTVEELKSNIDKSNESWKRLLIKLFTRLISSCYTTSLLSSFLEVQMVLIIRYKFLSYQIKKDPNNKIDVSVEDLLIKESIQEQFLTNTNFFLEHGIQSLLSKIETEVSRFFQNLKNTNGLFLKSLVTAPDILDIFNQIQSNLQKDLRFESFLLPSEGQLEEDSELPLKQQPQPQQQASNENEQDQEKLHLLLSETRNYLESERFAEVVKNGVDLNMNLAIKPWIEKIFEDNSKTGSLPWARVGTCLMAMEEKRTGEGEVGKQSEKIVEEILKSEAMRSFAFDIFSMFDGIVEIPGND